MRLYDTADWEALEDELLHHDWSGLDPLDADAAAEHITIRDSDDPVQRRTMDRKEGNSVQKEKHAASTGAETKAAAAACSGIIQERERWIEWAQGDMRSIPFSSKQWWVKTTSS